MKNGKGSKDRILYLDEDLLNEVIKYLERTNNLLTGLIFTTNKGSKIGTNHIDRMVKTYGNKTSIKKVIHFHMFRHTYGTKVLKQTGNIRMVQKVLGHSSITSTEIYTHIFDEDVKEVMTLSNKY